MFAPLCLCVVYLFFLQYHPQVAEQFLTFFQPDTINFNNEIVNFIDSLFLRLHGLHPFGNIIEFSDLAKLPVEGLLLLC